MRGDEGYPALTNVSDERSRAFGSNNRGRVQVATRLPSSEDSSRCTDLSFRGLRYVETSASLLRVVDEGVVRWWLSISTRFEGAVDKFAVWPAMTAAESCWRHDSEVDPPPGGTLRTVPAACAALANETL